MQEIRIIRNVTKLKDGVIVHFCFPPGTHLDKQDFKGDIPNDSLPKLSLEPRLPRDSKSSRHYWREDILLDNGLVISYHFQEWQYSPRMIAILGGPYKSRSCSCER